MRIVSSSVVLPVNYSVAPQRPQLACSTYSLEIAILNVDSYNNESTIHSYVFMQFGFVKAAIVAMLKQGISYASGNHLNTLGNFSHYLR